MSSILAFPATLGESVSKGGDHVSFEIIGKEFNVDIRKIHLFVPPGIAMGDGANFGNINLGTINAVKGMTADDVTGGVANRTDVTNNEALAIGNAILQKLGVSDDVSAGAATLEKRGVALNNQTTLTYEGANIRTFDLSFQLVASSSKEAETIRIIEHSFRKYMYAEREGNFALKYPPLFRIKFMKGKEPNKFMPRIFDSYLVGMNTTYNSNGNMYHTDGSPTDITIGLSFQEQRQLTRGDLYVDESDYVGPDTASQKFQYPESKRSV